MTAPRTSRRELLRGLGALSLGALAEGCSKGRKAGGFSVGYLNNITHAQPLVGAHSGSWARALGEGTSMIAFPAGPAVMEALAAGSIDAGFLGPSAVVNGFVRSGGRRFRLLSGAASGGASLVARQGLGIKTADDLRGKVVTASQIGSTPDVSMRAYLHQHGLRARDQGGDVVLIPMPNPEGFALLKRGQLAASWAQEPWASRMVAQAGCERVFDERELWPDGRFPTSLLVASRRALEASPQKVETLVGLLHDETSRMRREGDRARDQVADALAAALGKRLPDGVLRDAWSRLELTTDPLPAQLERVAASMRTMGYLPEGSLEGLLADGNTTLRAGPG